MHRPSARRGALRVTLALAALVGLLAAAADALAAGPPFPEPVPGQNVYDTAGIWSDAAEAEAEAIVDGIEARVGAEVVAYSQDVGYEVDQAIAKQQAAALGTQWGVGRGGFDDGLVLLFDIDPSGIHGEVVFVSGDGFRNTYLSDRDTTGIFDERMLPSLVESPPDYDGALLAGLRAVDAATTPQSAAILQVARIGNAVLGLVVAPIIGLLLAGWAVFHWIRFGRDPYFLDSASILMPAPPDQLTAASGALVFDGASSRRTLTTALLDLASRGALAFERHGGILGIGEKVAVVTEPAPLEDEVAEARQRLADRRPLSEAERYAAAKLRSHATFGVVADDELLAFGEDVSGFDERLEEHAVRQGWFREAPGKVRGRWTALGIGEMVVGGIALFAAIFLESSGLLVVGIAVGIAGIVTLVVGYVMPARTLPGATIRAMLAAYRRTLERTLAQSRSMDQVVAGAGLAWIETPDQALVWSVALGLNDEVDGVLRRSVEDVEHGRADARSVWFPVWYGLEGSGGRASWGGSGGGGGSIFSGSAVPNVGGMLAVLGSVGNAPSSSGGGGGGGFGGGGGGSF
jgi:uncharacterized membrane protein YgcG